MVLTICQAQPNKKKTRVIVLCDVSNSVTLNKSQSGKPGNLNRLKEYVKDIPDWNCFQLGSEIHFYPITNNLLSAPFIAPVIYNIPLKGKLLSEKKRVNSLKEVICLTIDSLAKSDPSSCVLLSVKRAVIRFNELSRNNQDKLSNELIIISDMLENSKMDKVRINMNVIDADQLKAAIKTFEKQNPKLDATNLNLKVTVLINSPGMDLSYKSIEECWQKWFLSIGIKSDNLFFYTGKPDIQKHYFL